MQELLVLIGLPASGKTTYARNWVEEDPDNRIRVNRDDIRRMSGRYWAPKRENLITEIEDHIMLLGLMHGRSVVSDNTNLRGTQRFETLLANAGLTPHVVVTVQDFRDVPVQTCINRDKKREHSVGKKVILDKAKRYNLL